MDRNEDIHERKTQDIETVTAKIASLRRDLQIAQWSSADLRAEVIAENDPRGPISRRDQKLQQFIQDIQVEVTELQRKKQNFKDDLESIDRLRHSTSQYLKVPTSNHPPPNFQDISIAEVRKYCSSNGHGHGPQNIKEILEKLFTYGFTLHFNNDTYKYVLPTLLTGKMYEEYQAIKDRPLEDIVSHFLARYYVGETPTMAMAQMAKFQRKLGESIIGTISRYRLLESKANTMFHGTKQEDPMKMLEVLLRNVGPKTRSMVEQLQISSLTKGEPVDFDALLRYAATTEQIMNEYVTNLDTNTVDHSNINNVSIADLVDSLKLHNLTLPDEDVEMKESINALRTPQHSDSRTNHSYKLRDKLQQSVKDFRGPYRHSKFDGARSGQRSRDNSRDRPRTREPSPAGLKQMQRQAEILQMEKEISTAAQQRMNPSFTPPYTTPLQPTVTQPTTPMQVETYQAGYNNPNNVPMEQGYQYNQGGQRNYQGNQRNGYQGNRRYNPNQQNYRGTPDRKSVV